MTPIRFTPPTHAAATGDSTDAAQAAAVLQASALNRPNSSLGTATLTIHAPVGSAAFADEVSARATDLAQSGISQAQLQLNPTDMGPVQVHITMQAGQASVWFGATHADTRAALEQSLPRLRELFAGAGMPLTDSGVFREPPQQQQAHSVAPTGSSRTMLNEPQVTPNVTQVANIRLSLLGHLRLTQAPAGAGILARQLGCDTVHTPWKSGNHLIHRTLRTLKGAWHIRCTA
ncbi:MAG: flagellar hook-length control protein FliK [Steroidobacteraceae bacterium]